MPRALSITRRRAGLVDLSVPLNPAAVAFQFKAATNWDGAFTVFATVPNTGTRSVSVPDSSYGVDRFFSQCRFLFNPNDYTTVNAAVVDTSPFYITVAPVAPGGGIGTASAIHVVMPYNTTPNRTFVLQGTVPAGAAQVNSLEIQLPQTCNDFQFDNDGAADLFVSFERPGAEYRVQPASTDFKSFAQTFTNISQVFLRGAGGTTTMSAVFTYRNNPST
jgi:hypothetical protein